MRTVVFDHNTVYLAENIFDCYELLKRLDPAITGGVVALDTETTAEYTWAYADELKQLEQDVFSFTLAVDYWKGIKKGTRRKAFAEVKPWVDEEAAHPVEMLKEAKERLKQHKAKMKAYKDALYPHKNKTAIIQVQYKANETAIFPSYHIGHQQFYYDLEATLNQNTVAIHNAKFDLKQLAAHYGIWLDGTNVWDTLLCECLFWAGRWPEAKSNSAAARRKLVKLKELVYRYFGHKLGKEFQAGTPWENPELSVEEVMYAAEDTYWARKLFFAQYQRVEAEGLMQVARLENRTVNALVQMEINGAPVDVSLLESMKSALERASWESEMAFHEAVGGYHVQITSNQQLLAYYQEQGYELEEVDEPTLKTIDHPTVPPLLNYRAYAKLLGTYVSPYLEMYVWHDHAPKVFGEFNQLITHTGRLSSSEPNLQNVPNTKVSAKVWGIKSGEVDLIQQEVTFRDVFVPSPGHLLLCADLSQVELAIAADLSGDVGMLDQINHAKDLHKANARLIYGLMESEDVPKPMRTAAKAIGLGVIYGKTKFGLSKDLNIPVWEADSLLHRFFRKRPQLHEWILETQKTAKELGYVTTRTGRKRYADELLQPNIDQWKYEKQLRELVNSRVQGTAADGMKLSLAEIAEKNIDILRKDRGEVRTDRYLVRLIMSVHDENLAEVGQGYAEGVLPLFEKWMVYGTQKLCPRVKIRVGDADNGFRGKVMQRWGEMK